MAQSKQNLPRSRTQKPKREAYASFGFRHALIGANTIFYGWMEGLEQSIEDEDQIRAKVYDPSKITLKIIERSGVSKASRRNRYRITRGELGAIKQDVRINVGKLGLTASGLSVVFDRIVPVGARRYNGETRKIALAPRVDEEATEIIFAEHTICSEAMKRIGVPEVRYPSADWIPHVSVLSAHDEPRKAGALAESKLGETGPLVLNLKALEFYDEVIEPMVTD